jgi:uncharacterized membrane protein
VGETTDRVEAATLASIAERLDNPAFGGQILTDPAFIPKEGTPVFADGVGYVQNIDAGALATCARKSGGDIFVTAPVGTFADNLRPLAVVAGNVGGDEAKAVASAFTVGSDRSFDHDPRFGLCVLAEVASRALSPAVNDPGTAIDVIGRAERVLLRWVEGPTDGKARPVEYPAVWVPPLDPDDFFDDVFAPIARDGAGMIEVAVRLQKALRALAATDNLLVAAAARRHSRLALERTERALDLESEKERVRKIAAETAKP